MLHKYSTQNSHLKYEEYHPGQTTHYQVLESSLKGEISLPVLQQTFHKIMQRHLSLRCGIDNFNDNKKPNADRFEVPLTYIDISTSECADSSLRNLLTTADAQDFLDKQFNLKTGPLWRAILIKTAANEYRFAISCHPLIADDRAISILFMELTTYYNQLLNSQVLELPAPHPTLPDEKIDDNARRLYWQNKLENLTAIKIQTPKPYNGTMKFAGKHVPLNLSAELISKLKISFSDLTLEEVILAGMYTLLHRYTGECDLTLGTTETNRAFNDRCIDDCSNWLTLRTHVKDSDSFLDIAKKAGKIRAEALQNQLSIDDVYKSSLTDNIRSTLRTTAPFEILLNFNSAPQLFLNNIEASPVKQVDTGFIDTGLFKVNLYQQRDNSVNGFINFNTDLFDEQSIQRLSDHLRNILQAAAVNPECKVHDIPMLVDSEIKLLETFNHSETTQTNDKIITDIFHDLATNPSYALSDHPSLVFHHHENGSETSTYEQFDSYTNQIANYLKKECCLSEGCHIALSISRSTNLAAMMIGALKAGLVIVPLETNPGSLFEYKYKNANAVSVIADEHTIKLFKDDIPVTNIDDPEIRNRIASYDNTYYAPHINADSPAYIMYSSGTSTGVPKASLLSHGGMTNLFHALKSYKYPEGSRILCTALPTFDAFLFDFLAAWASKGTVHLTSEEERYTPEILEKIIRRENINFAVFLPDLMSLLPVDLPLDVVFSIGAAAREGTFERWLEANPNRKIINGLGHTETGICLSLQEYHPNADPDLVGGPISNMKMFILDPKHFNQCPIGVPGEVFVAGPGLAIEYYGNPELTQKKFITMKYDPVTSKFTPCDKNEADAVRLYASGDYGSYQVDSNDKIAIKSLGRTDRRVKLFGVSIDLDGVESIINKDPHVQAVSVVCKPDMSGLVAFIVRHQEDRKNTSARDAKLQLRKNFRSTLLHPVAYPRQIEFKIDLPISANGKVDTKRLKLPRDSELTRPKTNMSPIDVLWNLWCSVLGSDESDNTCNTATFADMGGNSIQSYALITRIEKELSLTKKIGFGPRVTSMNFRELYDEVSQLLANNVLQFPDKRTTSAGKLHNKSAYDSGSNSKSSYKQSSISKK